MDFFLHYRNPNCHSSSSSSSIVVNKNNNNNTFHGRSEDVEKKKRKNKKMMSTKVKLSTDPQSVAARERRHRISERFKILRSLIPGGDTRNMDTVSMLEEVIQYVKFLKTQIWLHQTMISFENFDEYDNNNNNNNNIAINKNHHDHDQYHPHQDLPFDHIYDDYQQHLSSFPQMEYEMLPQLGFEEGSCFKVEGEDILGSFSHDHHHHHHVIYP